MTPINIATAHPAPDPKTSRNRSERAELLGDLHVQTDASGGDESLEQLAIAAHAAGLRYLAITDRMRGAHVPHGLDARALRKQCDAIDRLNARLHGVVVLKGVEVGISSRTAASTCPMPNSPASGTLVAHFHRRNGLRHSTAGESSSLCSPISSRLAADTPREYAAVQEPFDLVEKLELELLEPRVRADASRLDQLIADDFREVAGTGRTFGKDEVLARLPNENGLGFSISHMRLRLLAPTVCLVTYRAQRTHEGVSVGSERSSIWVKSDGWRMVHHQGTLID